MFVYHPAALSELEASVVAAFQDGAGSVTLDLDSLETLDSDAVRGLITLLRRSRGIGGKLVLQASKPEIRRTLSVMALDRLFPLSTAGAIA